MMKVAADQLPLLEAMATEGNPNSVSDAGVGAICALAAVEGGWLNVMINLGGLKDQTSSEQIRQEADAILETATLMKNQIIQVVKEKMV